MRIAGTILTATTLRWRTHPPASPALSACHPQDGAFPPRLPHSSSATHPVPRPRSLPPVPHALSSPHTPPLQLFCKFHCFRFASDMVVLLLWTIL